MLVVENVEPGEFGFTGETGIELGDSNCGVVETSVLVAFFNIPRGFGIGSK